MSEADKSEAPARPDRVPWGVGEAVLMLVCFPALQVFFGSSFTAWAAARFGPDNPQVQTGAALAASVVSSVVMLAIVAGMMLRAGGGARSVGLRRPALRDVLGAWKAVATGAAAYLCIGLLVGSIVHTYDLMPELQGPVKAIANISSPVLLAFAVVAVAAVVPLAEEVLFRGVVYLPLRRRLGVAPAALIVSLVFAVAHGYVWGVGQLFVLSLIFVALVERTRSLWPAIAAHAIYNGVNVLLLRL